MFYLETISEMQRDIIALRLELKAIKESPWFVSAKRKYYAEQEELVKVAKAIIVKAPEHPTCSTTIGMFWDIYTWEFVCGSDKCFIEMCESRDAPKRTTYRAIVNGDKVIDNAKELYKFAKELVEAKKFLKVKTSKNKKDTK
jgi:hypothetical protein